MNQKFCNILVHVSLWHVCHMTEAVQASVVGSIVVVGVLKHFALLHSMQDLKATQINIQCCLIQELILYKFVLGHNTTEAIKNICCAKSEVTVTLSSVTRWFKNFAQIARTSTIR